MEVYKSLESLISGINGRGINEWVHANRKQVLSNLFETEFYIISDEEIWDLEEHALTYKNERGDSLPLELKEKDLDSWMTVPMIEDVICVLERENENPDLTLIAKALLYYWEYDAFMV